MSDVLALLASRKPEERLRAVRRIIATPDFPERQTLLLKVLEDKVNYVATLAAEALGETADESAAAQMLQRLENLQAKGVKGDPGCHVRANLAFALGRLEYYLARNALRAGLKTRQIEYVAGVPFDTAAHLRANCALALAQMRAFEALPDVALLLFDRGNNAAGVDPNGPATTIEPRKAAAQALALFADPAARLPLALRLTFPETEGAEVLQECMQSVVLLEDPDALALLTPYLDHRDTHLAAYAALMLAQTRDETVPDLLLSVVDRFQDDPLRAVLLALTTLRTPRADAILQELAHHSRKDIRQEAESLLPPK